MKLGVKNNRQRQCRRASDGITILVRTVVDEKVQDLLLPPASYELDRVQYNCPDSVGDVYEYTVKLGIRNNNRIQCRKASDSITILVRRVVPE